MSTHRWADEPAAAPLPGVTLRSLWLGEVMVSQIELAPGVEVPDHAHAAEQIGTVLSGSLGFRLDGVETPLRAGDAYRVASGLQHSGRAGPQGCVLLEAFSAVRPEYVALAEPGRR